VEVMSVVDRYLVVVVVVVFIIAISRMLGSKV
jgi:hypothetical protein